MLFVVLDWTGWLTYKAITRHPPRALLAYPPSAHRALPPQTQLHFRRRSTSGLSAASALKPVGPFPCPYPRCWAGLTTGRVVFCKLIIVSFINVRIASSRSWQLAHFPPHPPPISRPTLHSRYPTFQESGLLIPTLALCPLVVNGPGRVANRISLPAITQRHFPHLRTSIASTISRSRSIASYSTK